MEVGKMKKITKTFYVSDDVFEIIKGNFYDNVVISKKVSAANTREIQVSWQEPEKKIEITESEFDAICSNYKLNGEDCERHSLIIAIKNDIFGASDER